MIHAEFISASLQSGPGSAPYHHFHPFTRSRLTSPCEFTMLKNVNLPPPFPPPLGDCVARGCVRMEQTNGFQSFRMRGIMKIIGKGPRHRKGNLFMVLELLNLIAQRFRPAFAEAATRRQV
jgi:hypothetical protein